MIQDSLETLLIEQRPIINRPPIRNTSMNEIELVLAIRPAVLDVVDDELEE